MAQLTRKILFSIDLEEFDIPEEYGQTLSMEEKLRVSLNGMNKLEALMDKHNITATIFTTAYWASQFPDYIKQLSQKHEIASHTYFHDKFQIEDLLLSRKMLTDLLGQEVVGLRMPRMDNISREAVRDAGYIYDSSLHPTWLPGRYNNFNKPRTLFQNEGIWELPASVTPLLRIPIFWLTLKNFPLWLYKALCRRILNTDGYIVFYVHPWEFTDLSVYRLPGIIKRTDGNKLLNKLEQVFIYLKTIGAFYQYKTFILDKD